MTPHDFVLALKAGTAAAAESELNYYQDPPSKNPPEHLKKFSQWFRQLSAADKATVSELVKHAKEGTLFSLLTYLDNLVFLGGSRGRFELFHVDDGGRRVRLNEPEGELLTDLFNHGD